MNTVGMLVKTYPKISETFILEEILGLERLGVRLHLFSLQAPTDAIAHADTARVRAPLTYLQPRTWTLLRTVLRHPLRALRLLGMLVRHPDLRGRSLRLGIALAHQLAHHGITHLHSHFISEPASTAQVAALLSGATFSISAHAKDIYLSPGAALRRKMAAARFTVTCTDHNLEYLNRHACAGSLVTRMYHGIDLDQFRPGDATVNDDAPLILSVGRLKRKKGLHLLVDACGVLRRRGIAFRCEIVGYGEELEPLRTRIDSQGLGDRVALAGKLDRTAVIERYRAATLFALPCILGDDGDRDGIPNALLEAMAMGLPVISTPISGIPEMLTHDSNALLVPTDDAQALADALQALLTDADRRRRLGTRARDTVAAHCCNDRNLLHLRRLLSRCLHPAPAAAAQLENAHARH